MNAVNSVSMASRHVRVSSRVLLLLLALLLSLSVQAWAGSVLSVGAPGGSSHHMNLLRVGTELAKRGHNFTMLISDQDSISRNVLKTRAFPGLEVMTFAGPPGVGSNGWAAEMSRDPQESMSQLLADHRSMAEYLIADAAAVQRLRSADFDLVLRDTWFWPGALIQDMLSIDSVELWPTAILLPWLYEKEYSIPNPIAYIPQFAQDYTTCMTFWQRVRNYLQSVLVKVLVMPPVRAEQRNFVKKTGLSFRTYETGLSTSAAAIAVGDWALELPMPMPPKIHFVGPILLDEAKALPADLQAFLDQGVSGPHAAVYVSMGTLARLSDDEVQSMAAALSALPNPVLWKLDQAWLPGNMTWESLGVGGNIKLIDWAPQTDVLAHAGVQAFVTQSGINSLYEAAFHAVPMVSVPFIGDQINNAAKAAYHGIGITVTPDKLVPVNGKPLQVALQKVLHEPQFKENAIKVSRRLNNRPRHPAEVAADVVERVLATGGDMYLDTHQHHLPWWQLSLLDVKAALLLLVVMVLVLTGMVLKGLYVLLLAFGIRMQSHFKIANNKGKDKAM